MSDQFPTALHASFAVEFATEDTEEAHAAVLGFQNWLRAMLHDRDFEPLRVIDLTAILADFSGEQQPLLAVIMQALVERGWRVDGNTHSMVDPAGNRLSLADAITAQTYREIGIGKG